jgi:Fungal fucose-specific lectin
VAYAFEAQGTQHVIYVGEDSNVHELWWDSNGVHANNLTEATGAPNPEYMVGYVFAAQGTQQVMYIGPDRHVHQLWSDSNGWHANDLTVAAGAPPVGAGLAAYPFEAQQTQHVLFNGADGHIYELLGDTNGWHTNDLTAAGGTPAPGVYTPLTGYAFEAQVTQHVIYVSEADQHIHELWCDSNGWHANDLTVAVGAPAPGGPIDLTAYAFEAQGTQHVFYIGADNHTHELWWDSNGWHTDDLTAATGAPPVAPGGNYRGGGNWGMVSYVFEAQGTQHVIYNSYVDNHVHELWWSA